MNRTKSQIYIITQGEEGAIQTIILQTVNCNKLTVQNNREKEKNSIKSKKIKKERKMKIEKFKQITSTHTYLKENNSQYTENTVILAEEQTGGIGTKGRNWHTGSNKNIAMSMLFRPQKNVKNLEGLTIEIAKRIQKIMEQKYNIKLTIKEPNDLMLNGKKICGILTESNTIGNKINYVIISIGFNVNENEFPKELENIATSLYKETGKEFDKEKIIKIFIKSLENII